MRSILIAILLLAVQANAETAIEIGISNVGYRSTHSGMLMLQERFGKYAVGLGYISRQELNTCDRPDCQWLVREQLLFGVERLFTRKCLTFGIGPYWFQNTNRITGTHLNIRVALEVELNKHLSVKASHFSNAGSGAPQIVCEGDRCITGAHNMGQDALLIVWRF